MKHSLFAVICFAVATAFAQPGMEDDADLGATEEVGAPTEETAKTAAPEKDEFSEFDDETSASAESNDEETPAATAAAEEEECDEEEEDCDEEDDDSEKVDLASEVDNTEADERDYAAYDAAEGGVDRFGIADEVRFWSAIGLFAVSAGSVIMGVLQHMKANEAKSAYDDLSDVEETLLSAVSTACGGDAACEVAMIQKADLGEGYTIADLQKRMDTNKETQDSYALWRNVWFGVAGATLTAGIVLFVW